MRGLLSLFVVAVLLALPAMASAQTGDGVSGGDSFRNDSSFVASGGGDPGDPGDPADPGVSATSAGDVDGSTLPFTGVELGLVVAAGLGLGAAGVALRRTANSRRLDSPG